MSDDAGLELLGALGRALTAAGRAERAVREMQTLLREARRLAGVGDVEQLKGLLMSSRARDLSLSDLLLPSGPGHVSGCQHRHPAYVAKHGAVAAWVGWEICTQCGATRSVDGDHDGQWN